MFDSMHVCMQYMRNFMSLLVLANKEMGEKIKPLRVT